MTCAKQNVTALLVCRDGKSCSGENLCENPQKICPRMPGENYEKCTDVCKQKGHAEQNAINRAYILGYELEGATLYLAGHSEPCGICRNLLDRLGIKWVALTPWLNKPTR